jgi:hypothetical protein
MSLMNLLPEKADLTVGANSRSIIHRGYSLHEGISPAWYNALYGYMVFHAPTKPHLGRPWVGFSLCFSLRNTE